ncbi:MAG: histidine ammonia-lyase [Acidimicrobiales bacterium]
MKPARPLPLDGPGVTVDQVVAVARRNEPVELTPAAIDRMEASRAVVDDPEAGLRYGISTGFGALATVAIPENQRAALQVALIRSHAAGMGPPVEDEVVRAMTFLRARTLAMGASGARPDVAQGLVDLLNAGITPRVPEYGSLGASGDLAPLAHVALTLLGEGEVDHYGQLRPAAAALRDARIAPLVLSQKEGLALTNGTDGSLGMLCLACHDAAHLLRIADVVAALTAEGLLATDRPYAADLQALRPHPGQAVSAANLRCMLAASPIVASHREDDPRVQDAYSIRCTPQVHGAARDTLAFAVAVVDRELASAIDNPLVLADGRVESCGNFHGAPLGYAADFLAIALADTGAIAERRTDRLLDPARSHGLPPFLAEQPGVDSGLMIAHYTAAALCEENRRLAAPASVDSLPTSAMQEDHVSMGWNAARKLRRVLANLGRILAVELVAAARGVELRAPLAPAAASGAVIRVLRERVPGMGPDRFVAPELAAAEDLVWSDELGEAVRAATGTELG